MENVQFDKTAVFITMLLYIVLMIGVIVYVAKTKKQHSMEDFSLGARNLGWLTSALASVTSLGSGFMFIGLIGLGYALGGLSTWYILADCINVAVLWTFFAWRFKKYGDFHLSIDVPDVLANMYHDKKNILRTIASFTVFIFMLGYISSQMTAAAKTMVPIIGISFESGIIVGSLIVLVFTFFAGFTGIAWTDAAQAIIIALVCFVCPFYAVSACGGWANLIATLAAIDPWLLTATGSAGLAVAAALAIGWIFNALCTWGQPHVVTRIMAIKDPKLMKRSALMGAFWFGFTKTSAIILGMCARALFPELPDPEMAFPILAGTILHPVFAGVALCAILAAIITTADANLLAATTTIVRNIYQKLFNGKADEKTLVIYQKILMVILIAFCAFAAIKVQGMVLYMVWFAYAGSGAALGIPLIVGLYWKRGNIYGATAGCIVGLVTVVVWNITGWTKTIIHAACPGIIFALIAVIVVSLLTQKDKVREAEFDEVYEAN
ncbi:MAG: sodium/proline symporter [Syntrophomonadaceae bacterium]|jgi:sodium/proline symporter